MDIGKKCKVFRESIGYTQQQVANDLGLKVVSVSAFECGRSHSGKILLWYIERGLKLNE